MKKLQTIILGISFVCLLSACASLNEGAKCVLGVSTKVLEDNRAFAIKQTFTAKVSECFDMSLAILKEKRYVVYSRNRAKWMIAAYLSETDSTPVGIFFKETPSGLTQIEVSSPSMFAKETVSNKLFAEIIKKLNPAKDLSVEQKEESNAVQY